MSNLPKHAETLHIRLRTADREVITARATRAGLTVSEYGRRAMLGTLEPIRPAAKPTVTAATVAIAPPDVPPNIKGNAAMQRFLSSAGGDDPA